jgi:hypothetical protein
MFSWDKSGDRVAMVQMNSELRNAQLEMLSAQCATDRLRLRFSVEDIARHAQRDVLRKALSSATALHDYYTLIAQRVPDGEALSISSAESLEEGRVVEAIAQVTDYLHEQRERFRPSARPIGEEYRREMAPFFAPTLLDKVGTVALEGHWVPNPPIYAAARAQGFTNLPEIPHMESLTFEDVLVFQDKITSRSMFHGLVHAVQFDVLGLQRYTELFIRGFVRTRAYISVPLEAHAFTLESMFAADPAETFSVEENVRLWVDQDRY